MTLINRQEMVVDLQPRLLSFYVLVPLCYKPVCAFLRLQMQGCDPKEPTSVFVLVWCLGTPLLCVYIYICRCRSDVPRCRYIYMYLYDLLPYCVSPPVGKEDTLMLCQEFIILKLSYCSILHVEFWSQLIHEIRLKL